MSTESVRRSVLLTAAIATLIVALDGCCRNQPPSIVTVAVPYVSVIHLDPSNAALGSTGCDLNGQPIIYINPRVSRDFVPFVLLHERIHVQQSRTYPGGCLEYVARYEVDEAFRLHTEAEAFCGVYEAQLAIGYPPSPDLNGILRRLMFRADTTNRNGGGYEGSWSEADAKKAMRCWKDP